MAKSAIVVVLILTVASKLPAQTGQFSSSAWDRPTEEHGTKNLPKNPQESNPHNYRATLVPIQGLGKTVARSDSLAATSIETAEENKKSKSNSIPALSAGFSQESLPPSIQQELTSNRQATEQERNNDQEIIKLLKPLPIDPKNREILTQRYPNGKIQIEREVARDDLDNYLNDGKWKKYHTDGRLMGIGRFEKGQMVGLWKRVHFEKDSAWFLTADFQGFKFPLISSAEFKDGEMDGLWVIKDSEQKKIFELQYKAGRRNGPAVWWYPNGKKRRELTCKDDLLHGQWQEWDDTGKLVRENWFREGHRIAKNISYFRENRPETEQSFLDPKLELVQADDWWNATLGRYEATGEAVQEGPVRAWYDNGQRHMAGYFKEGAKDGEFAWWHPNGTRKLLGHYDQGQRTGRWTWWHENGIKAAEIEFEADQPTSELLTWDENGIRQITPDSKLDSNRESLAKPPIGPDTSGMEELPGLPDSIELLPADPHESDSSTAEPPAVESLDLTSPGSGSANPEKPTGEQMPQQSSENSTVDSADTQADPATNETEEKTGEPPPKPNY